MSYVFTDAIVPRNRLPFPAIRSAAFRARIASARIVTLDNPLPQIPADDTDGNKPAALDATGGFDFHLGVYSRF